MCDVVCGPVTSDLSRSHSTSPVRHTAVMSSACCVDIDAKSVHSLLRGFNHRLTAAEKHRVSTTYLLTYLLTYYTVAELRLLELFGSIFCTTVTEQAV